MSADYERGHTAGYAEGYEAARCDEAQHYHDGDLRDAYARGRRDAGRLTAATLTGVERKVLLSAWPWPREAATTAHGFDAVAAAVELIIARRVSKADHNDVVMRLNRRMERG